jgi:hypothetical protein
MHLIDEKSLTRSIKSIFRDKWSILFFDPYSVYYTFFDIFSFPMEVWQKISERCMSRVHVYCDSCLLSPSIHSCLHPFVFPRGSSILSYCILLHPLASHGRQTKLSSRFGIGICRSSCKRSLFDYLPSNVVESRASCFLHDKLHSIVSGREGVEYTSWQGCCRVSCLSVKQRERVSKHLLWRARHSSPVLMFILVDRLVFHQRGISRIHMHCRPRVISSSEFHVMLGK